MESSDDYDVDSFVWTDASSAIEKSAADSSLDDTMKDIYNDSESELGYKKTLHKNLFNNEDETTKVKHEADSPVPMHKAKCKRKRTCSPEAKPSQEYLDARVKQEQLANHVTSREEQPKKKKRKKERHDSTEQIIEDKFSAEETIVEERPEKNTSISINVDQNEYTLEKQLKKEKKKKKKKRCDSVCESENNTLILEATQNGDDINKTITQNKEALSSLSSDYIETSDGNTKKKKSSKISDRIQFEDEEGLLTRCDDSSDNVPVQSTKLRRFLKVNSYLQSLTYEVTNRDATITKDDDIWLFNCPLDMNIESLKDKNLSIDNKCKVKLNSQTFVGNLESDFNRAAILTFGHSKPVIRSLVLSGIVNFHKRIPKAHFIEDNVITNNQTNFISLPNTKCRHPLFGSDYKKAIKVPSSVKLRLENPPLEPPPIKTEKKKKKSKRYDNIDMNEDAGAGGLPVYESGEEACQRKPSKRDQPKKKSKHIKRERELETWDSEKAIEENLFNY